MKSINEILDAYICGSERLIKRFVFFPPAFCIMHITSSTTRVHMRPMDFFLFITHTEFATLQNV